MVVLHPRSIQLWVERKSIAIRLASRPINYIYDGARVIEERYGDRDLLRRYVYGSGIDEPISMLHAPSSTQCFYLRDDLGSLTELVDESGDMVEHYRYSSYGKRMIYDSSWNEISTSSAGNPSYFTGRRFDEESGLYYYRARMYSAEVGRFLQVDPIGYVDGFNLYRYYGNNPLNRIDLHGNKWWEYIIPLYNTYKITNWFYQTKDNMALQNSDF